MSNLGPTEARPAPQSGSALVSVIIATYNRAGLVGAAVESALAQTYRPLEVIVVDDGSSDDTEAELSAYGDSIVVLRHERNRGLSAARNTGIGVAGGRYLGFLDSDDLWEREKLVQQVSALRALPEAGFCYCDYSLWERGEMRAEAVVSRRAREAGQGIFEHLIGGCFVSACSMVIPKERLDAVGLFDELLGACEDWDMALRLALRWPTAYVDEPLVRVRVHGDNMSANRPRQYYYSAMVLRKALQLAEEAMPHRLRALRRKCARVFTHYGKSLFYARHPAASAYLRESIRLCPVPNRVWGYWLATLLPTPLQELVRAYHFTRERSRRLAQGDGRS